MSSPTAIYFLFKWHEWYAISKIPRDYRQSRTMIAFYACLLFHPPCSLSSSPVVVTVTPAYWGYINTSVSMRRGGIHSPHYSCATFAPPSKVITTFWNKAPIPDTTRWQRRQQQQASLHRQTSRDTQNGVSHQSTTQERQERQPKVLSTPKLIFLEREEGKKVQMTMTRVLNQKRVCGFMLIKKEKQ